MRKLISLKNFALAAVVASGLAFASSASAGDCYTPPCVYKPVTTWQIIEKPFVDYVTKYHACGTPYTVKVVSYRTVRVPVTRLVKVCY